MEDNAQSHFKVTTWPQAAVEVPPVLAYDVVRVEAPWIEYDYMGLETREIAIPSELYLREARDVDLNDVDALAGFGAEFGLLGYWPWPELPELTVGRFGRDISAHTALFETCAQHRAQEWEGLDAEDEDYNERKTQFNGFIHVDEVRLYLSLMRDMVSLWRLVRGEMRLADIAEAWSNRVWAPPSKDGIATLMLADILNAGLRTQSARIEVVDAAEGKKVAGLRWGHREANTYQAMCLQLRNDIAANAEYLICANETCRRLFSKHRSSDPMLERQRAGSRYCSDDCRQMQKQREYRQRKASGAAKAEYRRRPPLRATDQPEGGRHD